MKAFSERLKQLRAERKLSQRDVAKALGIDQAGYARFELGGETNFEMLVKIATYFGVTPNYLLGVEDY